MPASYPGSAKSFTTKTNGPGQTIDASHVNDLQLEVTAIEQDLIAGLPAARGGTGLTAVGAAKTIPQSDGSVLAYAPTLDISSATGGQIVFPAVQNASADANTLDDYEENTWTPSLGGSATYTARSGTYTKVGRKVTIMGSITVNAIGTGSTTEITGLPFAEGGAGAAPIVVGNYASLASSAVSVGGYVTGSIVAFSALTAASTASGTAAVFGNGTQMDFSCTYFV